MTYAQKKAQVVKSLRVVRKWYRMADSKGEILERELDRLISRKTLITGEELTGLSAKYRSYASAAEAILPRLTDSIVTATH